MADPPDPPTTYDTASLHERMTMFVPHAAALGMELVKLEKGVGVMRTPWRAELVGDPETDVIASGVVTALLDHTCGLAVNSASGDPVPIATLDLRIDYMRAAAPRMGVTVEAVCTKLTRTVGFVRATAWDVDPADPVATAQAAFMFTARG
ncbi:MAG TPA: PaaI family thioesterase [Phenylobacterium sp.]|nr:PaaI family thioesterase [Phenylobacterium sp.]